MRFDIVTIFPELIDSYAHESILGRAQKAKKVQVVAHDLREYTSDKHNTVDDTPYGGGPGMLLKVEPFYKCLTKLLRVSGKKSLAEFKRIKKEKGVRVVLMSARGARFDQQAARSMAKKHKRVVLLCGRYEGVDERVMQLVDEEISVGDYVLTGGELPALTVVDAVSRLVPGVLGKMVSSEQESHSRKGYLEHPHYTRPEVVEMFGRQYSVPEVLLSGDHKRIEEWREEESG